MRETRYKGKYLEVTEEVIGTHKYERVSLRPGVKIFPVREGKLLLINEFRRHEGSERWKVVSGWIDKDGKDALDIAKEELMEEVGMVGEDWQEFHYTKNDGATVNIETTFFIVKNPVKMEVPISNPDGDVVRGERWVSLEELWQLIDEKVLWWDIDALVAIQILRKISNSI